MVNPGRHHHRHRHRRPSSSASEASSSSSSSSALSASSSVVTPPAATTPAVAEAATHKADRDSKPTVAPSPQRAWRFLDTEETCHFFNTEMVISTNDVLQLEVEEDAIELPMHLEEGDDPDSPREENAEAAEPEAEERIHTKPQHPIESKPSNPAQLTYEAIFNDFDDLHLPTIARDAPKTVLKRRAEQCQHVAEVLQSFCNDLQMGQNYVYRKRSEFLRVCFQRAIDLQTEPAVKNGGGSSQLKTDSGNASIGTSVFQFQCSRLERPIDVSVPELHPRKWPHLPYRNPLEWKDDAASAVEFAKRVCELPVGSLLYEPIDVDGFTSSVVDILEAEGVDVWCRDRSTQLVLSVTAVTTLAATLAMAVRFQSFSLLALVGDVMLRYGASTILSTEHVDEGVIDVVTQSTRTLQSAAQTARAPATYPRALVAQWKMCSYQPSTSDAIATDGLYLYIYGRSGLLKVGTGRGATLRDFVYDHNKKYCRSRDAERSWLCLIGNYLYCRSIAMPSNHVDRIAVNDLSAVDELFFAPPQQVHEVATGANPVYAMVTNGVDLFTIHSIDSQKRTVRKKSRVKKPSSKDVVKALLARASGDVSGTSGEASPSIAVGDRVIRGPQWKWGSQDGEQGSPGTVQRISTWGGVKGCGITVRWDKNQRVNTYRWGAEGSYDLVVVVEKPGGVLEKKPLPSKASGTTDEPSGPRHLFVVNRYRVSQLVRVVDLDDEAMNTFLGIPSRHPTDAPKVPDEKYSLSTSIHEHTLCLSSATTAWMCDGGTPECLGDNSGVRYRCENGCDFDLCEVCLASTLRTKAIEQSSAPMTSEEIARVESTEPGEQEAQTSPGVSTTPAEEHVIEPTAEETENAQIDELVAFWCGLYSRKECAVAYERCGRSFEVSVSWMSNSGEELKKKTTMASVDSVILESPPNSSGLDPVLLVAGSFYVVDDQVCIVSPPGLYQSEARKRSAHASDAAWFFSLKDGSLRYKQDSPILLRSVPAGSPICVDLDRRRILVFSGHLNCVEEYVIASNSSTSPTELSAGARESLSSVGARILGCLHRLSEQRWALPAYKRPRQGLQDWINQIQLESCVVDATSTSVRANAVNDTSAKLRARQTKKIRLRLLEFEKCGAVHDRGYVVPYCLDFGETGLRSLLCRLDCAIKDVRLRPGSMSNLVEVTSIWRRLLQDCFQAGLKLSAPSDWSLVVDSTANGLLDVTLGHAFDWENLQSSSGGEVSDWSGVIRSSQDIIMWGVEIGLFHGPCRWNLFAQGLQKLLSSSQDLPDNYTKIMKQPEAQTTLRSSLDCRISLVKRILTQNTDATDGGMSDLVRDSAEAQALIESLFQLSARELIHAEGLSTEANEATRGADFYSPVEKALLSLFNGCAIDVMAKVEVVDSAMPRQRRVSSAAGAESLLQVFAVQCFRTCANLLKSAKDERGERFLARSMCFKLLPLVFAMMSNGGSSLWASLEDDIFQLVATIGKLHGSQDVLPSHAMPESRVVESPHPYNRNQASMRKVVRIAGATCLHIQFDPQCSTSGEADFVFVTPGHEWFHSERVPFGENGIGDAGGCFFGTRENGNWPHPSGGISIWGDTATIMLCSTSQERASTAQDDSRTWGLRCVVRGINLSVALSWRADTLLAVRYTVAMLSQRRLAASQEALNSSLLAETKREVQALVVLKKPRNAKKVSIVKEILSTAGDGHRGEGVTLVERIELALGAQRRSVGQGARGPAWQKALRMILAIVTAEALQYSDADLDIGDALFQCILRGVSKVEQWMVRRVQVLKEWHFLQEDNLSVAQMTERLSTDVSRVKSLCALKGIHFKPTDLKHTITELHQTLTSERVAKKVLSANFHRDVAEVVVDKAEYALEAYLDAVEGESQSSAERYHIDAVSATIVEYLTSDTSVTDIRLAEQQLAVGHGRGRDALHMLQRTEHLLATTSYGSMSVAGSLGASWTKSDTERYHDVQSLSTKSTIRAEAWCQETCNVIRKKSVRDAIRLASMVDFLAAYKQFPLGLARHGLLKDFVSGVADLLLERVVAGTEGDTSVGKEAARLSGYSMTDLAWMGFRYGMEALFADENEEAALSILHEMIGRLGSLCARAMPIALSDALGRVMKIATAHVDAVSSHANSASWVELCISQLKSSLHGQLSSFQLASLRMLTSLSRSSAPAISESAIALGELAGSLLERIGYLQSSVKHRVDESENKSRDCCIVIFENEKARSKLTDALDTIEGRGLDLVCLPTSLIGAEMPSDGPGAAVRALQESDESSDVVHRNVRCDSCNQSPMRGYRFKCSTCANYDLCTNCYLNQSVHDLDHQFVRHLSPSSAGELLQPRSNVNGAIVPEAALVGSLSWTASIARARLEAKGYVVLARGSSELCLTQAKLLSEVGFAATVMEWPDAQDLEAFYDWEGFVQAAFEPGAARLSRRSTSNSSSTSPRKANRSVLKRFNEGMASKGHQREVPDTQGEVSELVTLTRLLFNDGASNTSALLSKTIDSISSLGTCVSLSTDEERAAYYRTFGLINVLGGFAEPLRFGAAVAIRDPVRHGDLVGVVKKFTVGGDTVDVIARRATDLPTGVEEVVEMQVPTKRIRVIAGVDIGGLHSIIASTPQFFTTFAAVLKASHKLIRGSPAELAADAGRVAAMELVVSWLRMYMTSMASFPTLLDKQTSAGNGNLALLLFQLAKTSKSDDRFEVLDNKRGMAWAMQQAVLGEYRFSLASRPIGSDRLGHDASCIYGPGANGLSDSTEYVFNMYAHSSRAELPKQSGRNKLLEYWEKNVIPAIESYVAGSFKSYEMDYFFAQLREPLREGNSAAAMKIAFTLCDGHVPSGCHYPDPDTDWTALQIDDIEVGARYWITSGSGSSATDSGDWPTEMRWTVGHSGVVRNVYPSGLVLMQLHNPQTSRLEHWWYHVDFLASISSPAGLSERSVDAFDTALADLIKFDMDLMGIMARKCVFAMLKQAPEQFPLVSERQAVKNHFNLVDILRMASAAELGFEADTILGTTDVGRVGVIDENSSRSASRYELMDALQHLLTKRFEYSPPASLAEAPPLEDQAAVAPVKKGSSSLKYAKSGKAAGNVFVSTTVSSSQPTATTQALDDHLAAVKYRYNLMEALVHELKRALDSSAAFLKQNAFMVSSDSPPKPMIMLSVPGASCLVVSFAVHPVLMDLPAGSSLEFFEDEACTTRIFGYFGDKRGLNFLPPLVVPGEKCFVRASQASYARYKFRVDPLTSDFGLALWIAEEVYQRITTTSLTGFELESIMSSVLNSISDYLTGSVAALAPCTKGVMSQVLTKMINFAITRSLSNAVPLSKLSALTRDLAVAYDHELSAQKGLFSLPTQQLAELLSAVEEVSRLRGGAPTIDLSTAWWHSLVQMAMFTRVLTHKRDPAVSTDIVSRFSCGRMPIEDVDASWETTQTRDLLSERMVLLQRIPRTKRVPELEVALSRFVQHIALEECGEADDQTVLSATEVYRFGILAKVVHLPTTESGETVGYAVVDVGRHEIVPKLLTRLAKEKFDFEGDATEEDKELAEKMRGVPNEPPATTEENSGEQPIQMATEDNAWACGVCTLENPMCEVECAACGSPIPSELVESAIRRQSHQHSARDVETSHAQIGEGGGESSSPGWECEACTLVNPWALFDCVACGSERGPNVVEPAPRGDDNVAAEDSPGDATMFHILSGVCLDDVMRIATTTSVKQIDSFLCEIFIGDKTTSLSRDLNGLLRPEATTSPSGGAFVDRVAEHCGLKGSDDGDEDRVEKLRAGLLEVATAEPVKVAQWLREAGYDLRFELNHYASIDDARASQAKWTYQMDIQLVTLARQIGARVGVLSLMDLCPSHINAALAPEGSPLATLESRDLRLRFALLKTFNKTALEALPLVNLRNLSDPHAVRARLVAVRQLLFPAVKIRFLAETQDNANLAQSNLLEANVKRPIVTLDRRRVVSQRATTGSLSLQDPTTSLFASTMSQLAQVKPSVLRAKRPTGASDPFVAFIVIFAGENVVGEGGPYRQLFNDIATELLSSDSPLFVPTQNNAMKIGEFRDRYLPRPSSTSKAMLDMFEFVGVLMGCCIRTGVRLNIRLAPIVWKMLVKQSLSILDLEHIDWSVCESLKFLEAAASGDNAASSSSLGDVYYESFTTALSDGTTIELKPGGVGIPVTKSNCKEYVRLAKAARFQECKPQVDAMLRGIGTIVPVQLLQLCTWSELQQWVCGSLAIDIELLKRHTLYSSGMSPDRFPHLDMFWRVLSSFSEENKRRFINFAWGQDTLPADDAEFDRTHTRLLVKAPQVTKANQDSLLPKADTCFFNIELPAYSSEAIMRERLLLAITMCTSMDGDEQTGRMDLYFSTDDLDDEHME